MSANNYITSSCVINNHGVYKNGQSVFENKQIVLTDFLLATYRHLGVNYPKFHKMDNLSKLGWLAAEVLLKDEQLLDQYKSEEIGVVLSNANASLDTDQNYFESIKDIASPGLFVYTLPNIVIGEICIKHHFKGENAFFVFENFDVSFMQGYVSNLINSNTLQVCICGWVEVLNEEHKVFLFLIEREKKSQSINFTTENINQILQ